jgi:hypothetical protein
MNMSNMKDNFRKAWESTGLQSPPVMKVPGRPYPVIMIPGRPLDRALCKLFALVLVVGVAIVVWGCNTADEALDHGFFAVYLGGTIGLLGLWGILKSLPEPARYVNARFPLMRLPGWLDRQL